MCMRSLMRYMYTVDGARLPLHGSAQRQCAARCSSAPVIARYHKS